ncbi:MAG: AN1-type zinc finger domain-containing protein [Candidatus Bathyarchaeia archaeon]
MSGLIFSLLVGSLAIGMLRSLLSGDLGFKELPMADAWRSTVIEGGHRVEVIVRRSGERLEFILPDESVPEEICKRVVKRLTAKIYAKLRKPQTSHQDIRIVGPVLTFCRFCLEPIADIPFRCRRCGNIYCSHHRLPERHECSGGEEKEVMVAIEEPRKRKRRKREKTAAVTQEACG